MVSSLAVASGLLKRFIRIPFSESLDYGTENFDCQKVVQCFTCPNKDLPSYSGARGGGVLVDPGSLVQG